MTKPQPRAKPKPRGRVAPVKGVRPEAMVVTSDHHVGSTSGLCSPAGIKIAGGGYYYPNKFQEAVHQFWEDFWTEFVPSVTADADLKANVLNGDLIEGLHHNRYGVVTSTWEEQSQAALDLLGPRMGKGQAVFVVRGTEAHANTGAEAEERIAKGLGAERNGGDEHSAWQWWIEMGGLVFQLAHHIGVTSSAAYESSAPMREMVAGLVEAAQWKQPLPHVFVRSHRHRFIEIPLPAADGRIRLVITPGWQLRTPFVERIDRLRMPHIGGVVFIVKDGKCQVHEKLYPLPGPEPHRL